MAVFHAPDTPAPSLDFPTTALSRGRVAHAFGRTPIGVFATGAPVAAKAWMTWLFDKPAAIHEGTRSTRHFLGFPCH